MFECFDPLTIHLAELLPHKTQTHSAFCFPLFCRPVSLFNTPSLFHDRLVRKITSIVWVSQQRACFASGPRRERYSYRCASVANWVVGSHSRSTHGRSLDTDVFSQTISHARLTPNQGSDQSFLLAITQPRLTDYSYFPTDSPNMVADC